MSKPLELTVHPKGVDHHGESVYLNADGTELFVSEVVADGGAIMRRFTDAELAAEYWRSWNNVKTGSANHRDWTEGIHMAREHAGVIAGIDPRIAISITAQPYLHYVPLRSPLARVAYARTFPEAAQTAALASTMEVLMDDIEAAL